MSIVLVVLVLALAIAGGFLGDLLEVTGWVILVLAATGAIFGFLLYWWARKALKRWLAS